MKILVTGYKGFIAPHVIKALRAADHDVDVYEWGELFHGVMGYDWVIHIGAISSTTERNIEKLMRQNFEFSVSLYEDCKRFGVNLQFSSSASVYGFSKDFSETTPVDPRNHYAWSKYLFERCIMGHQGGNIVQAFRYFNVYGPGEEHKGSQASPYHQFEKQYRETGKVRVFHNSENYRRDFIHVDKIVDLHLKFLDIPESGIWNFGTGTTKSFLDVAKTFTDNIEYIDMPEELKCSYQTYTCSDTRKLDRTIERYTK
jgi:ADP-L-glycero-D-manno-heptose 6-epimerase